MTEVRGRKAEDRIRKWEGGMWNAENCDDEQIESTIQSSQLNDLI